MRSINVGAGSAQGNAVFQNAFMCRRLVRLLLGLALLVLGVALEHLEVLAVAALLGHPDAALVLEVRLLLRRRRSHPNQRRAYPLAHYSRPGVALVGTARAPPPA